MGTAVNNLIFGFCLVLLVGCAGSRIGDECSDKFTINAAYYSLEHATIFSNHCGDGLPLTNEAVALHIIVHRPHPDRMKRVIELTVGRTVEARLYALLLLEELAPDTIQVTLRRLSTRDTTFRDCSACTLLDSPLQPEIDAILKGERRSMLYELDQDMVVGWYD